jgi:hypothetical protein
LPNAVENPSVALSALEMTFKDLGYAVEMGAGVRAAELVFSS